MHYIIYFEFKLNSQLIALHVYFAEMSDIKQEDAGLIVPKVEVMDPNDKQTLVAVLQFLKKHNLAVSIKTYAVGDISRVPNTAFTLDKHAREHAREHACASVNSTVKIHRIILVCGCSRACLRARWRAKKLASMLASILKRMNMFILFKMLASMLARFFIYLYVCFP